MHEIRKKIEELKTTKTKARRPKIPVNTIAPRDFTHGRLHKRNGDSGLVICVSPIVLLLHYIVFDKTIIMLDYWFQFPITDYYCVLIQLLLFGFLLYARY